MGNPRNLSRIGGPPLPGGTRRGGTPRRRAPPEGVARAPARAIGRGCSAGSEVDRGPNGGVGSGPGRALGPAP